MKVPNLYQLSRLIVSYHEMRRFDIVGLLIRNVYGGHRWGPEGAWDAHHTGWTPAMLHAALGLAGFEVESDDGEINNLVEARKR